MVELMHYHDNLITNEMMQMTISAESYCSQNISEY